jgi:hypothetical protein
MSYPRLRRKRRGRPDDRGSLPMALLVTLVGMSTSAALVPVVIHHLADTRASSARTTALHAAQAGIDVALGHIRAATDLPGAGRLADLPSGPLRSSSQEPDGSQYQVTIDYLDLNGGSLGNRPATRPHSAVLVSIGVATPSGAFDRNTPGARTLQATYTFRTSTTAVPGGQIHVRSTNADLCLDAGSGRPAAGTNVTMQPCQNAPQQQIFTYSANLTLTLVSSRTTTNPYGMCLDAGGTHGAGPPATVKLQACAAASPAPAQQWIFNNAGNFAGTSNGIAQDGYCFNVQTPDRAGSLVVLGSGATCNGNPDSVQTFRPDSTVGAGAAGPASRQLASFAQFSRCLNVTDAVPSTAYLTAWPCLQVSNPSSVPPEQVWTLPSVSPTMHTGTGAISTRIGGAGYCLRSPGTASGAYPTVETCPAAGVPAAFSWTVYGATGSFATSYQIKDSAGLCLAAADPTTSPTEIHQPAPGNGSPISRILLQACTGGTGQKWNAPADLTRPSPLTSYFERTAG